MKIDASHAVRRILLENGPFIAIIAGLCVLLLAESPPPRRGPPIVFCPPSPSPTLFAEGDADVFWSGPFPISPTLALAVDRVGRKP